MTSAPIEVLMVEDDPEDVALTREAMRMGKILVNMNVVSDGVSALAYLRREGEYAEAVRPDVVLLDLNLPKRTGQEVLKEIKDDPKLKSIPVVVLTTSESDQDVLTSYNLGTNCYLTKPVDFEQFIRLVKRIEDFWFTVVRLPPRLG